MADAAAERQFDAEKPELSGELGNFQGQLEEIRRRAKQLVMRVDDGAFNWRPEARRWSICECLDHLIVSGEKYLPAIGEAIAAGREQRLLGEGPEKRGLIAGLMIRALEPPPSVRFKAPGEFRPRAGQPAETVGQRFAGLQDEIEKRLHEAQGLDLARIKLRSPGVPLLRFTLGETFAILLAHERRHVWQAEQVMADPAFPA